MRQKCCALQMDFCQTETSFIPLQLQLRKGFGGLDLQSVHTNARGPEIV